MINKLLLLILFIVCTFNLNAQIKDTFLFNNIDSKSLNNIDLLTESICNVADKDQKRVENIFYWITHYMAIDVNNYNKEQVSKKRLPNEILKSKKGDDEDFALLLKAMCESAGIRSQIIEGYEKNDLYENGAGFYKPNHTWNAVLVNSKWEFVDAYNGAGIIQMDLSWWKKKLQKMNKKKLYTSSKIKFKQEHHPEYLFENPEEARLSKIPMDPIWQLTDTIMPLSVFEKTADDIKNFNENYSEINKFKTELSEFNRLADDEQVLDCADRTFAYNPRYTEMKAKKHLALAAKDFEKTNKKDLQETEKTALIKNGKNEIQKSKDYLMIEKSEIGKEYNELQKVNNEKRTDVIKYKQKFTTINTKFITQSKSKINGEGKKINTLKNENNSKIKKEKENSLKKWTEIKTQKPEKDEDTKEISTLKDSIKNRNIAIEKKTNSINNLKTTIEQLQEEQNIVIERLKFYLAKTDSSFMKEAIARSKKQDSFDDSVKAIRSNLYYYKTVMVDSLQQKYFNNYDTIIANYEAVKKEYNWIIDANNKNIKDYETYKKNTNKNNLLENNYQQAAITKKDASRGFVNNNLSEINYLKNNEKTIASMKIVYEKENKYFNYLSNTEDDRKELVKKVLNRNEELEKKRNTYNINNLKEVKEKSIKKRKKKKK